jgi:hypothetical protein
MEKLKQLFGSSGDSVLSMTIVGLVAVIVASLLLFNTDVVSDSVTQTPQSSATVRSTQPTKTPSSGSVWEDLKAKGLQGFHYTLNVHGKGETFKKQDCTVVPDPVTGEYSNNIFIPSNGEPTDNNQVLMTSGSAKGKWASTGVVYGVRDACTAPFDGDAAELTLPPNPNGKGYYVTARVLGKPTENPELTLSGELVFVKDEQGNDLLVLGLVTDNGFTTPTQTITRTKGKVSALDVTGLFEWSGQVCYFDGANYCYDEAQTYLCTDTELCCVDFDADGITDSCVDPVVNTDGTLSCTLGSLTDLACRDYVNEWVFNIGDLVGYMWDLDAQGDFKLANFRFYPVQ